MGWVLTKLSSRSQNRVHFQPEVSGLGSGLQELSPRKIKRDEEFEKVLLRAVRVSNPTRNLVLVQYDTESAG